jgi:argininosuccinate lyase
MKKDKKSKNKAWSGRFRGAMAKSAEDFNASINFDRRLWRQDIIGSISYAKALVGAGVLSTREAQRIIKALEKIFKGIESGRIKLKKEYEDIHMNIEKLLIDAIGDAGKKLHTGRSRNEQVVADLRMYIKLEISEIISLIKEFQSSIINLAENNIKVIMPGYTHLQRAQPVLFAHHMMAYFEMLERDKRRFLECYRESDVLPLGSGALSGNNFNIDRNAIAKELGFTEISRNSMDAVSDRDFVIDFISACSIAMVHLSRLSEELVLWSSYEFNFIEISDAYSTGSSLMPQKKNPDVAELIRGKSGRVFGNLMRMLVVMKALPLAYNKDVQEDKEALFDAVDTTKNCIAIITEMMGSLKVNKEEMMKAAGRGFQTATDLAYYLVSKGVPFRQAHEIVGKIIAYCEDSNMHLEYLSIQELKKFSDRFSFDAQKILGIENSVNSKDNIGGTAPNRVKEEIKLAKKKLQRS